MRCSSWGRAAAICLSFAGAVQAEEAPPATDLTPPGRTAIETESRAVEGFHQTTLRPSEQHRVPIDPAELLKRAPGATVNGNGPLTGISQYRGMFGGRVHVRVDGLNVSPACPNGMDPPLSFIPAGDLREVVVDRGVSPVSAGSESIGGTVRARARRGEFGDNEGFEAHGMIGAGGQTVDSGYGGNALLWLSNDRHLLQISGSYLRGNDLETGGTETIIPTEYRRWNGAVGYRYEESRHKGGLS